MILYQKQVDQFSNRDFVFIYIYIYTRFNAYRRRKEIWGIGSRGGIDASDARWPGTSTTISTYFFSGKFG